MSGPGVADVLVVAAHPPELEALAGLLCPGLSARVGADYVAATAVGIGIADAAVGTLAAIQTYAPRAVVLSGTCGVYGSHAGDVPLGDVIVAGNLRLVSTAATEERGAFPGPMPIALASNTALTRALSNGKLKVVDVATTLAITTDDALAARVAAASGCAVEHLEAFAVATACARAGVATSLVLAVANRVGSTAREEWRAHHEVAGRAATEVIATWLRRGAVGLAVKT